MTREELKRHCEKQVEECERWAKHKGEEPGGKIYEEHKLILELLEENEDFQKYIDKANYTNSQLIQLIEKHKMNRGTSDDCVSRKAVINLILEDAVRTGTGHRYTSNQNMNNEINEVRSLPPVTPTRKKGRWIKVTETEFGNGYQCSECGRFILTESIDGKKLKDFPYCHCGAEMESEE